MWYKIRKFDYNFLKHDYDNTLFHYFFKPKWPKITMCFTYFSMLVIQPFFCTKLASNELFKYFHLGPTIRFLKEPTESWGVISYLHKLPSTYCLILNFKYLYKLLLTFWSYILINLYLCYKNNIYWFNFLCCFLFPNIL